MKSQISFIIFTFVLWRAYYVHDTGETMANVVGSLDRETRYSYNQFVG